MSTSLTLLIDSEISTMSCEEEDEGELVDVSEILFNSLSTSSKRKYAQALTLVNERAKIRKRSDPCSITA